MHDRVAQRAPRGPARSASAPPPSAITARVVPGEQLEHHLLLARAERVLALPVEEGLDRLAEPLLELAVGVERLRAELGGERAGAGGLAGAHEAHEHEWLCAPPADALLVGARAPPARRRCGRRRTSRGTPRRAPAPPSPPPPRRPPAPCRSRCARAAPAAGSLVSVSTERSGFVSVGSGFMAPHDHDRVAGGHAALDAARRGWSRGSSRARPTRRSRRAPSSPPARPARSRRRCPRPSSPGST